MNEPITVVFVAALPLKTSHAGQIYAMMGFVRAVSSLADPGLRALVVCPYAAPDWGDGLDGGRILAWTGADALAGRLDAPTPFEVDPRRTLFNINGLNPACRTVVARLRKCGYRWYETSHGEFDIHRFRKFTKKFLYCNFLSGVVRHASGFHFLSLRERRESRLLFPFFGARKAMVDTVQVQEVASGGRPPRSDGDPFTFGYIGRLDIRHKGLDILVKAFARCLCRAGKGPRGRGCGVKGLRLVLVGPDWRGGEARLRALAGRLGVSGRVEFPGPKFGDEKRRMLESFDAFVTLSRWDCSPVSVHEALAAGVPTIVSGRNNLSPQLSAAHAALVTDMSVASLERGMGRLLDNPLLLSTLSANGRSWIAAEASPKAIGWKLADCFRRCLGQ